MVGYILVAGAYGLVLVPLAALVVRLLRSLAGTSHATEIYEGIGASCIVAVCAALALTRGVDVQAGILIWLAFIVISGIAVWLPPPLKARSVAICASIPAIALLGALLAIYLLPLWLLGAFGAVASVSSASQDVVYPVRALLFILFLGAISIPAIGIAIYARSRVLKTLKWALDANPARIERLEKVVNSLLRLGATVAAVFVVWR